MPVKSEFWIRANLPKEIHVTMTHFNAIPELQLAEDSFVENKMCSENI